MSVPISKRHPGGSQTTDTRGDRTQEIWRARRERAGHRTPAASFQGRRVLTLESRRSPELALLVMNYGGTPVVAPSLREVPLEDNHAALAMAEDVIRERFDLISLMTGVGLRMWITLAAPVLGRDVFVRALGRARILARGPKPVAALRELGLAPWATVPSPNTWRELIATLDARSVEMPLAGARVAVQEYGLPNPELAGALAARGASVFAAPIYRWAMPEDRGPLRSAVHAIVRDEIDLVVLTAGVQLVHLLRAAAELGLEPAVRRGLERLVIASIGPMTSEEIQRHGLPIAYESSHPKMGFLVKELAERCDALLRTKGGGGSHPVRASTANEPRARSATAPRRASTSRGILGASEPRERATRTERAGAAARESAYRGALGASEPRERAPRTERAGEATRQSAYRGALGASEPRERAPRTERAGEAARESACRGVREAKPLD